MRLCIRFWLDANIFDEHTHSNWNCKQRESWKRKIYKTSTQHSTHKEKEKKWKEFSWNIIILDSHCVNYWQWRSTAWKLYRTKQLWICKLCTEWEWETDKHSVRLDSLSHVMLATHSNWVADFSYFISSSKIFVFIRSIEHR